MCVVVPPAIAPYVCIVFTTTTIIGLTAMPVLVVPRGAVRPSPRALLGRIGSPDPAITGTKRVDFRILASAVDRRKVVVVRAAVRARGGPFLILADVHEVRRLQPAKTGRVRHQPAKLRAPRRRWELRRCQQREGDPRPSRAPCSGHGLSGMGQPAASRGNSTQAARHQWGCPPRRLLRAGPSLGRGAVNLEAKASVL